jgi:hypothetical protein
MRVTECMQFHTVEIQCLSVRYSFIFLHTYVYLADLFVALSTALATSNQRRIVAQLVSNELLSILHEEVSEYLGYYLRIFLQILD